ncbi:hypothetical protein ACE4Z5_27515, partial [Salmonella enterica]|uniref:hypothetical protein n=1 Tax=Salmonella enterica TaxID=28901 RepID=UPI003D2C655D
SRLGRMTGTLDISRPNIRDARQTPISAAVFLVVGETLMRIPFNPARASWHGLTDMGAIIS